MAVFSSELPEQSTMCCSSGSGRHKACGERAGFVCLVVPGKMVGKPTKSFPNEGWRLVLRGLLEGASRSEARSEQKRGSHLEDVGAERRWGHQSMDGPLFPCTSTGVGCLQGRDGSFCNPVCAWLVRVIISCSQQRWSGVWECSFLTFSGFG